MRILFLTARLPYPPTRGDRLRAFNFLRHLSREHRITLLSFITDNKESANLASLRPYCEDIHLVHHNFEQATFSTISGLWGKRSLQSSYYRSQVMQQSLDHLLEGQAFDAIYIHLFRMAQYVKGHTDTYRILDMTDVISSEVETSLPYRNTFWRGVYRLELPRMRIAEIEACTEANETWLISAAEKRLLEDMGCEGKIIVVPNGVDQERFHPLIDQSPGNDLVFVGHLGVFHNVDAAIFLAEDIYPQVRKVFPDARLRIIGAEPDGRVQRLANLPGVEVTGHVTDLNAYLNQAGVFVAPLRFAAGVQNKVLEAMAAGLPVVTTSAVNNGLMATSGEHLIIADNSLTIAAAILDLLTDESRRHQLGQAARRFISEHYRWELVADRVREIEKLLHNSG